MSNNGSSSWERTRRSQVLIARSSVLVMALLVTLVLAVLFWPVQRELRRRDLREFEARAGLVEADVRSFMEQAKQLASQLPSRTRIRQELIAYLQGKRSLESYVTFTEPKLRDAVDAAEGIVAAYRLDPKGKPLVGAYLEPGQLPPLLLDRQRPRLLPVTSRIGEARVLFVSAPICDPAFGLAGFDLVAISLERLATRLTSNSTSMAGMEIALTTPEGEAQVALTAGIPADVEGGLTDNPSLLRSATPSEGSATGRFRLSGSEHYAVYFALESGWQLAVAQRAQHLHEPAREDTLLFAGIVLLVGLVAIAITLVLLRILSQRTLAETGQLSNMVEERTSQLELLLRELHHRVKNDMNLVHSLLSLHAMQSEDPRVEAALKDAQGSVILMSRVYDHLHRAAWVGDVNLRLFLSSLLKDLGESTRRQPITIEAQIEEVMVKREVAVPLAIIVNELVTNSVKYAGRDGEELEITVVLRSLAEGGLELLVTDNGTGFPAAVINGTTGFGLSMVETMARQLRGELELSNHPAPTVRIRISERPDSQEGETE